MERSAPLTKTSLKPTSLPEFYFYFLLAIIVQVSTLMGSASALRLVSVDVPSPALIGESVELTCLYDLQNEQLYSVKWYKDDVEFYRFVPNDYPPAQYLPAPGINIDLGKSSQFTVFLTDLNLHSTGKYRCEVSGEAPLFDTQEAEKELQVFVLPSHGPKISGGQPLYKLGDNVHLNCTSAKSKPNAVLKWFINDQPVRSDYEVEYPPLATSDGLQSTTLGLKFSVSTDNFEHGNVRFRCVATISRAYTMTNEELVFGGILASSSAAPSYRTWMATSAYQHQQLELTSRTNFNKEDNPRTKRKSSVWRTILDDLIRWPTLQLAVVVTLTQTFPMGLRCWL